MRAMNQNRVTLDLSGGLVTTGGEYGGSFLTGVSVPVQRNSPVRLGLDTGVMFSTGVALPILVSIMYVFEGQLAAHPYVAGTVGPVIGLSANGGSSLAPAHDWIIGNGIKLAILIRPGIRFNVAENLDVALETALGGMTGIFYIAPSLGLSLRV